MRRAINDKESILRRKKRKKKKNETSGCNTTKKKMYTNPFLKHDFLETNLCLFDTNKTYNDDFLKKELIIAKEYVIPFLTKKFEVIVSHMATPVTKNENVKWKQNAVTEDENEKEKRKGKNREKKKEKKYGKNEEKDEGKEEKREKKEEALQEIIKKKKKHANKKGEKGAIKRSIKKNGKVAKKNTVQKENSLEITNDVNKKENKKESTQQEKLITIESQKNDFGNISPKSTAIKKTGNTLETDEKNESLMQKGMSKNSFSFHEVKLLNKNFICSIYPNFCGILQLFNCDFIDSKSDNDKNNTEVIVFPSHIQNTDYDEDVCTEQNNTDKKQKTKIIKNKEITNHGVECEKNKDNLTNIYQRTNTGFKESENSYGEDHFTINTCVNGCEIKRENSNRTIENMSIKTKHNSSSPYRGYSMEKTTRSNSIEKSGTSKSNENKQKQEKIKSKEFKHLNTNSYHNTDDNINEMGNKSIPFLKKEIHDYFENEEAINENIVFVQIENFTQKIEEYIADEKIFRAQKLIEHVKKYTEFYINYFKGNGSKPVVEKLLKYYQENCASNNNVKYNINSLKSNIILHFLNFFRLTEMVSILNEYCYYFSVDPLTTYDVSDSTSENNDNNSNRNNNSHSNNINLTKLIEETTTGKSPSHSCSNSDLDMKKEKPLFFNLPNDVDICDLNKKKVVIVDKLYHHHFVTTNVVSNTNNLSDGFNAEEQEKNTDQKSFYSKKPRNMVRFIRRYSRRLKRFRKHKQNKEGWIKENDKFLDLWYQVDNENNISVHVRAKLPYKVNRILSILNETDLSVNWAPFLTSAQKVKNLSKASSIISQLYEYPVIGKKESIMYCLGANALDELGCIILCCRAPPDFSKDIIFYENLCKKLQINKKGEIIKIKDIPISAKKTCKEITFFDFLMPKPTPKIDRQRAADLCFLLYPLEEGKSTVLELFLHFEVDFKYTPIKMVTFFIKKIVRNMYDNIVKCCKNYDIKYSHFLKQNKEFYDWLDRQIQKFLKSKQDVKLIDSISLRSYNEPETNE